MATYLFAWNPALWNWPEMQKDIRQLLRRGHFDTEWNSGRVRNIEVGSRAFLVRVGVPPKGIFGVGHTLTEPVPTPHWRPERAAAGAIQQRLWLRLEALHQLPPVTYDDLGNHRSPASAGGCARPACGYLRRLPTRWKTCGNRGPPPL